MKRSHPLPTETQPLSRPKKIAGQLILGAVLLGGAVSLNQRAIAQSWGLAPAQTGAEESSASPVEEATPLINDISESRQYSQIIERTKAMIRNPEAQRLAAEHGLQILDVTWEDTGRYDNSAVGPNISDMTIQVEHTDPRSGEAQLHLMPVIRYPNFSDVTADVALQRFSVLTGNEKGETVEPVLLADVLENLRAYLSQPASWLDSGTGRNQSLLAERDSHVLVSAQAAFLPIPEGGEATFNPVLFNYQSYPGDPAVLTLLATREGTSITVIDNQRDGFGSGRTWGQRLFFNQNGERSSLTGKRLSDFRNDFRSGQTGADEAISLPENTAETGLNMVMLIQVPLKQKERLRGTVSSDLAMEAAPAPTMARSSNVEAAVIGHGPVEGPFTEIDSLAIERDPDFPIRVTVQFYKATNNGVVSAADLAEIDAQIKRIYDDADYVGSLVTDGRSDRPTDYSGEHTQPEDWWAQFWQHSQNRLDLDRQEALELLRRLRSE